ncbi:Zn-ribbon domain-containing OB-fold protein [Paracoccus sp. SCSIO 75233]|uniref:Zn-ribbon domain-containing OB-fold protein n=1 Tax=Paracoccus sp. SCSIO 75233 TaxID=3017782 RepID=UPI0022F06E90|nr:Zn-ribbon domain-containing OB-fold protein [Paracoccus sp. SCSIO 75233]WBU53918.1 Zn-ribbon domain-containing OB-fold protein [Paracoccus sp. SCSIO 75233]
MTDQLPKPVLNGDSEIYWTGAVEGKLLLRQCKDCGKLHFMPRHICPNCWSEDLEWIPASGRGKIHSFTVIRRASDPAFVSLCPYVVALIDLEEGPRMMANILGENALDAAIGTDVEVMFEDRGDGAVVPQFQLAEAGVAA